MDCGGFGGYRGGGVIYMQAVLQAMQNQLAVLAGQVAALARQSAILSNQFATLGNRMVANGNRMGRFESMVGARFGDIETILKQISGNINRSE